MFIVAWNSVQKTFSVEELTEHCENNLKAFHRNETVAFSCLAAFSTLADARKYCDQLQEIRNQRG